jgi:hypothetical protein
VNRGKRTLGGALLARILAVASALALLGACQQPQELKPGQVWGYDNRAGEGASTILILHIEKATPIGDVYFVSVRALDVRRLGRKIRTTEVWPLAFTRDALARSLRSHQWDQPIDRQFFKYLDLWLREARDGRAAERTFGVPIKEALDQIEAEHPGFDKRLLSDSLA